MGNMRNLVLAGLIVATPIAVRASATSDAFTQCIVHATNSEDNATLSSWIFSAMGDAQTLRSLISLPSTQKELLDTRFGELFTRLLTRDCRQQYIDASRGNGQAPVGQAFDIVGQTAVFQIMKDPAVVRRMAGVIKHIDMQKLMALQIEAQTPQTPTIAGKK